MRKLCIFACVGLALAACQPMAGPEGNSNATAPAQSAGNVAGPGSATLLDERLLYAAETAYNVPAHAYVTADARGQLSPAVKAQVRPILIRAYDRLLDARRLYRLGNAADFQAAANEAIGLANSAKQLLEAERPVSP